MLPTAKRTIPTRETITTTVAELELVLSSWSWVIFATLSLGFFVINTGASAWTSGVIGLGVSTTVLTAGSSSLLTARSGFVITKAVAGVLSLVLNLFVGIDRGALVFLDGGSAVRTDE